MNELTQQFNYGYFALYLGERFENFSYNFMYKSFMLDGGMRNIYVILVPKFNFDIEILKDY